MAQGVSNSKLRTQRLNRATTAVKVATSAFQAAPAASADNIVLITLTGANSSASETLSAGKTQAKFLGWQGTDPSVNPQDWRLSWSITGGKGASTFDVLGPNLPAGDYIAVFEVT